MRGSELCTSLKLFLWLNHKFSAMTIWQYDIHDVKSASERKQDMCALLWHCCNYKRKQKNSHWLSLPFQKDNLITSENIESLTLLNLLFDAFCVLRLVFQRRNRLKLKLRTLVFCAAASTPSPRRDSEWGVLSRLKDARRDSGGSSQWK